MPPKTMYTGSLTDKTFTREDILEEFFDFVMKESNWVGEETIDTEETTKSEALITAARISGVSRFVHSMFEDFDMTFDLSEADDETV